MASARSITASEVAELRARYAAGDCAPALAIDFGISSGAAWSIATGRTRREVDLVDLSRRVARPRRLRGDEHPLRRRPELAVRGSRHPRAKLSESEVLAIRARRRTGESFESLAEAYAVSRRCIQFIVARRRWRHI